MLFKFSSSTIASISGAVFITVSIPNEVATIINFSYAQSTSVESIRTRRNTHNRECSFTNGFKAHDTSVPYTDTGILGCESGMICIEDNNSLGGRCVKIEDLEVAVDPQRFLVACTFKNGTTDGTKCVGTNACAGIDDSKVGCGSCIGADSCSSMYAGVTVGENSCLGSGACYKAGLSYDGTLTTPLTINDGSCHDNVACKFLQGDVGTNSCIGGTAKGRDDYTGYVCYNFQGPSVGDYSCIDYAACYQYYSRSYGGTIGHNSCNGPYSCNWMANRDIDDRSCNGIYACAYMLKNVGYGSCNGLYTCYKVYYTNVGGCLCNGDRVCYELAQGVDKDYSNCPQPTKSPTKSPSNQPTKSPTTNPSKSPINEPTTASPTSNSPSKNPSKQPTDSPTSSPSKNPSKQPTNKPTSQPTKIPTKSPSNQPTKSPTKSPSNQPTKSPTKNPSKSPINEPTTASPISNSPSKQPTNNPTRNPSKSPSNNPTKSPSKQPTNKPTSQPTKIPTKSPSNKPTKSPTKSPTKNPSKSPNTEPTTANPSRQPTDNPTRNPSKQPTNKPTSQPTKIPTKSPSNKPTKSPSNKPTKSPTKSPTKNPSKSPNTEPTTASPSKQPTDNPTKSPSKKPTKSPTRSPSKKPSKNPTKNPTLSPTMTPVITIQMESVLEWDIVCPLADPVGVGQIVEQSIYENVQQQLTDGEELVSVYVNELCGEAVADHSPYPLSRRRLQTVSSAIKAVSAVSTTCNGCQDDLFNAAANALVTTAQDGSLSASIQSKAGGTITATIGPDVSNTNKGIISNTPTSAPNIKPSISEEPTTTKSSKSEKVKETKSSKSSNVHKKRKKSKSSESKDRKKTKKSKENKKEKSSDSSKTATVQIDNSTVFSFHNGRGNSSDDTDIYDFLVDDWSFSIYETSTESD